MIATKLRVEYWALGIIPELDSEIRDMAARCGFAWTGQGYNVVDEKRDIVFEPVGGPVQPAEVG